MERKGVLDQYCPRKAKIKKESVKKTLITKLNTKQKAHRRRTLKTKHPTFFIL